MTVLAFGDGSPRSADVEVRWLGGRAFGWPGVEARLREAPWLALQLPTAFARAAWALAGFDRVVAHWAVPSAVPCALASRAPLEVWLHGADVRLLTAVPGLGHAVARLLARRDAQLVFVASHLRSAFLGILDAPEAATLAQRSRVEPAPIEVPERATLSRLPEVGEAPYVVWVGRMVGSKAPALAVDVCRAAGLRLVLVGDGPASPPPSPGVTQLGFRPRAEALRAIAHATVLLGTSREEGAPTVVREARALGVPVVALPAGDLSTWAASDPGIRVCDEVDLVASLVAASARPR